MANGLGLVMRVRICMPLERFSIMSNAGYCVCQQLWGRGYCQYHFQLSFEAFYMWAGIKCKVVLNSVSGYSQSNQLNIKHTVTSTIHCHDPVCFSPCASTDSDGPCPLEAALALLFR